MASAVITVDMRQLAGLQSRIDRLIGLVGDELPDAIGALLASSAQGRINGDEHRAPDGSQWPEWSGKYSQRRPAGKSLLRDSGALVDALQHEHSADTVTVFAAVGWAATHQFGDPARNIPARPYLGMSNQDVHDIEDLVDGMVAEVFG